MRILILTHPRSGGLSLMAWISQEKNYEGYHEPDLFDLDIKKNVLEKDNIVVKIFPHKIKEFKINFEDFINTFDKIIYHKRENKRDTAISLIHANQTNTFHDVYKIDEDWLIKNEKKIENTIIKLNEIDKENESIIKKEFLITTYDSIYLNKTLINDLCNYLIIDNPYLLDILDYKHRLRDGDFGMKNNPPKKTILIDNSYLNIPLIYKRYIDLYKLKLDNCINQDCIQSMKEIEMLENIDFDEFKNRLFNNLSFRKLYINENDISIRLNE
jgi:hypothetical protein